jgi:hypothetical protein
MFSVVRPTTDIPANGSFAPEAAIRAEASFTEFFQLISFCLTAYQSAN